MAYGHANLRDARRRSAVSRIESQIIDNQKELTTGLAGLKKATTDAEKNGIKDFAEGLKKKIERAEECLKNTQANMGKGSCAMQKTE